MSRPSRRETLTPWFTEAVKLIDVRVVCVPTVGSTSSHCASKRPMPGMMSSGVGRPAWLSTVRRYFDSVCVPPRMTPSRKRAGIWPLPLPPVEVATSLPAAERSDALAPTALLPSTAPAFWAKSTAAMAVPERATTSAMTATTMAGDGRRSFTTASFGVGARDPTSGQPGPRRRGAASRTIAGDQAHPRTHVARIGARRRRAGTPAWHADHAHPHRSRPGQHRSPLSRVALRWRATWSWAGTAPGTASSATSTPPPRGPRDHLPRRPGRHARLRRADRRAAGGDRAGLRPLRPARQRALGPPARRRSVVLDRRALRARAHGPGRPPRHRRALPRRRTVVGRHARAAARARAPARAAERGRGRLAVVDPRPSSRAATSCSTRWTRT